MNPISIDLLTKGGFAPDTLAWLSEAEQKLSCCAAWQKNLELSLLDEAVPIENLGAFLEEAASACAVPLHTVNLLQLIHFLPDLKEAYDRRGLSEDLLVGVARDLRCKSNECLIMEGVSGTRSAAWHVAFYRFWRYALGRLQFENRTFTGSDLTLCGRTIHTDDVILGIHIPSDSPLTREACLDSLQRAFAFYGKTKDNPLIVHCRSWLLNPDHRTMLPADSNIVRFIDMFHPLGSTDFETFNDAWRVFGRPVLDQPVEQWPADTALRRGYRALLLSGKKARCGEGVLVFDGTTLLTEQRPDHDK